MKKQSFGIWLLVALVLALSVFLAVRWFLAKQPPTPIPSQTNTLSFATTPFTTTPFTTTPKVTAEQTTLPQTEPPLSLEQLFPTYQVTATLLSDEGGLPRGYKGKVRNAKHETMYRVFTPKGETVRVDWNNVTLSPPPELALPAVNKAIIERAVNEWGLTSQTDYLVWTNLYRLETYVFQASPSGWRLVRRMDCSAGDLAHPTPVGQYRVQRKIPAIGKAGVYSCPNAVGFWGNYLYHAVIHDPTGQTVTDGRLGQHISNGCIRLGPVDSRWLYEQIPVDTAVYIN